MTVIHGDCLDVMKTFPDNHFSAIVTDPPYGLHFMGKDWDSFRASSKGSYSSKIYISQHKSQSSPAKDAGTYDDSRNDEFQEFIYQWSLEALRIVKPGGHVLMFGAPRRYHRQVCGLEDAGWEIRDCLMWLFGSGFPKSHNHFGIEGYGTALKPAYEPIIMAMKPLDGTFKQNAAKWGQAGINIDGCRIATDDILSFGCRQIRDGIKYSRCIPTTEGIQNPKGRWPANVLLDEEAAKLLDEQSGTLHGAGNKKLRIAGKGNKSNSCFGIESGAPTCLYDRGGGASRFFYCAKASRSERNYGLDEFEDKPLLWSSGSQNPGSFQSEGTIKSAKNNHPTVKPLKLMEYLIKLVMPPKDGLLLDPFAGSGTTIIAAKRLGFESIGIEKSEEYCEIARKRLETCDKEPKQMDLLEALKQKTSP